MNHEDMVYGLQYNDGAIQPMPSLQAAMIASDSVYGGTVVWRYETSWEPLVKDDAA